MTRKNTLKKGKKANRGNPTLLKFHTIAEGFHLFL
jgi:hypothetical protein